MPAQRSLELGTGLFVALGFAALFFLTTQLPGSGLRWGTEEGYQVSAKFNDVGDLREGAPVAMAGVRVGRIVSIGFDPQDFRAIVQMRIEPRYDRIPEDSDASVQTQGLLGGKFVAIGPGGSDTYLRDGGTIEVTQGAIVIENLVNKFFANFVGRGNASSDGAGEGNSEAGNPVPEQAKARDDNSAKP